MMQLSEPGRQVKDITDEQVREACVAAHSKSVVKSEGVTFTLDWLAAITGLPVRVCYRKLEQCDRRGLVNYGVSLRSCWWEGDDEWRNK